MQFLDKLETFTAATMQHLTEKGLLKSDETLGLADYVMDTRSELSKELVENQQKIQANTESTEFANRELEELTSGSSKTERDAVIVVDRTGAAGKVMLNYLVTEATWTPQYRLRAGAEKDPVQVEYLAAIMQQTGEDWTGVDMTLSTAQPQLNATPPELLALDITVVGRGNVALNLPGQPQSGVGMMGGGGGMGGMGGGMRNSQMAREQSQQLRKKAQQELITNNPFNAKEFINEAAALEQADELLALKDEAEAKGGDLQQGAPGRPSPPAPPHTRGRA